MYRRRHHCRMCGQVFCNQCSSYYIDKEGTGLQGPVRSCRLCFDQLGGSLERESKPNNPNKRKQKKLSESAPLSGVSNGDALMGSSAADEDDERPSPSRPYSVSLSSPVPQSRQYSSSVLSGGGLSASADGGGKAFAFETPESRDRLVSILQVLICG